MGPVTSTKSRCCTVKTTDIFQTQHEVHQNFSDCIKFRRKQKKKQEGGSPRQTFKKKTKNLRELAAANKTETQVEGSTKVDVGLTQLQWEVHIWKKQNFYKQYSSMSK